MTNKIDMTFYINLSCRTDRKFLIENELNNYGLNYERFEAYYIPDFGALGCSKSHLDILKIARERNYENILIFEDDFKFVISKEKFQKNLTRFFDENILFDCCLLSYNLFQSEPTNFDFLLRVRDAQTTSGYIVNNRCYNKFIDLLEKSIINLEETKIESKYAIDQTWKFLQKMDNWYCFKDRIGIQRSSYSNVEKRYVDYNC